MDTLQAIRTRRSIRDYLDVPVEWEKIGIVLDAGRLAPSAGNTQEWNFIVVTDGEVRQQIAESCVDGLWMAKAPVFIVITANIEPISRNYGIRGERLYSIQDCAVAATQMMLAAHVQGLGTCWVGSFDEHLLGRLLSLPDTARPQVILTLGYPDEHPSMPLRKRLEAIVFLNSFGNRIRDIGFVLRDYNIAGKAVEAGRGAVSSLQKKASEKREKARLSLKEQLKAKRDALKAALAKKGKKKA